MMQRVVALSIAMCMASGAYAASGTVPLGQLLNSDGSLKSTSAVSGSVDVAGFRMTTAANGAPLFIPESKFAALSARSTAVDPDAGWDNRFWRSGAEYTVGAIAFIGSDMYVAGDIPSINNVSTNGIAKWDGSTWSALGSGLDDSNNGFEVTTVSSMSVIGTDLYVAGEFSKAGGITVSNIAKWDGSSWSALGSGVDGDAFGTAVMGTDLYVTGRFTNAGGITSRAIAKWNGTSWSTLGSGLFDTLHDSTVASAMAVIGTDLYVGGFFNTAGGNSAQYIAKWDGSTWSAVGGGLPDMPSSFAVIGSNLYAAGRFHYIEVWDGTSWSSFSSFDGDVNTLATDGTNLYAGGQFSNVDSVTVNHAAKWDGSTWSALGTGVNPGTYSTVNKLVVHGADVYAGGYGIFNTVGGVAHNLARWDGTNWSDVGQQTGGLGVEIPEVPRAARINAMVVSGNNMYAAGYFTLAGDAATQYVMKWDGTSWSTLGSGLGNGTVGNWEAYALAIVGTDVYVGGNFNSAGGVSTNGIARWNGSSWSDVGGGLDGA
ncbi:MAG TPA: hypothetical protein VMT89_12855, partial [Candidatus Acidoferrales bacterium]|nr:hypothetical protein [Candidatus Acidoferrales bacterium]